MDRSTQQTEIYDMNAGPVSLPRAHAVFDHVKKVSVYLSKRAKRRSGRVEYADLRGEVRFRRDDKVQDLQVLLSRACSAIFLDAIGKHPDQAEELSIKETEETKLAQGSIKEVGANGEYFNFGPSNNVARCSHIIRQMLFAAELAEKASRDFVTRLRLGFNRRVRNMGRKNDFRLPIKLEPKFANFPQFRSSDTLQTLRLLVNTACDAIDAHLRENEVKREEFSWYHPRKTAGETRQKILDHFEQIAKITGLDLIYS